MVGLGQLDRVLQIRRSVRSDNGLEVVGVWSDHGTPIRARRRDISDQERASSQFTEAVGTSRFVVRSTGFTRDLSPLDRLVERGQLFEIVGIKEFGSYDLEITATRRSDLEASDGD